ncbi:MAG: IS4 family transposase [Anaerolineales bacterium]|nr:IS4 family transposase [Anaerolineales bacterium]
MPINTLYHTWFQRLRELRPTQRITQLRNFAWLLVGIHQSRSVCLSRIAGKIPSTTKLLSWTRRLSRFLDNEALHVRDWYEPITRQWIAAQAASGHQIRLIVDGTKVGFTYQLLMVSLAYRHRAIPIAWTWVRHVKGHSTAYLQLSLLRYVHSLLPKGIAVLLVGDCEFGAVEVLRQLDQWHWDYVLRQKTSTHTCLAHETEWQDFGKRVEKAGQSRWLGKGYLTESAIYPVNLLIHWQVGENEPWCLATNLPDRRMALQAYGRRMWTEDMFGDLKRHGFDLESTMLRHARRLSRLTLAVVFLYVWCMAVGTRTIRAGLRHLVDRKDRRDLSVFQIGLRYLERQLINAHSFQILLSCQQ